MPISGNRVAVRLFVRLLAGALLVGKLWAQVPAHVIELTADRDSRYKIAGLRTPEITVNAGEQVVLRVTANRGKSWNRDGSIHGFSLLRAKDRTRVEGWDLLVQARQAGIYFDRTHRTGRIRRGLHRDLQRRA